MQDDGLAVAVQFAIERDSSGQLQPDGRIPPFWGFPHDESDDDCKLLTLACVSS